MRHNFRSELEFLERRVGSCLISQMRRKRNYVNVSSTSVRAVEKTVCAEKWRKKKQSERSQGVRKLGPPPPPIFQTVSPVVSAIDVGRRRRRGRGSRRRRVCGKSKTYKTYKTDVLLSEKKLPRRHERIADHSLPNANYLYSPLAIKMCRAWTGAEEEGTRDIGG